MRVEAGAGAEALIALGADVWLLSCVSPHVSLKKARPVKCFATNIAGQHCLLLWSPPGPSPGHCLLRPGEGEEGAHTRGQEEAGGRHRGEQRGVAEERAGSRKLRWGAGGCRKGLFIVSERKGEIGTTFWDIK